MGSVILTSHIVLGGPPEIADDDLELSGGSTRLSPALSKMQKEIGRREDKSEYVWNFKIVDVCKNWSNTSI